MAELDVDDIQRRMDASIASLHNEFMGLRAGRASTGMLEPIMVDAYGSKMPIIKLEIFQRPSQDCSQCQFGMPQWPHGRKSHQRVRFRAKPGNRGQSYPSAYSRSFKNGGKIWSGCGALCGRVPLVNP